MRLTTSTPSVNRLYIKYGIISISNPVRIQEILTGIALLGMGEKRNVYRLLVGKPEGKRPLGRPRGRWIDNIKIALLEIGVSVVDWIGLAQDRYR
jgi:hypothetical protein